MRKDGGLDSFGGQSNVEMWSGKRIVRRQKEQEQVVGGYRKGKR